MVAGNVADIALGIQAAKGTPSIISSVRSFLMDGGIIPIRETKDVEETSGGRLRNTAFVAATRGEGSPKFAARPGMLGMLLYGAFGAKAVTGAGDPWTHTFTLALTQPYLTAWRSLNGLFERFTDCKITSLNFESTSGGILAVTAGIVGLAPAFKSAIEPTGAAETTEPFLHMDGKGQFLVETVPIASVAATRLNFGTGVSVIYGDSIVGDQATEGMQEAVIELEQTISNYAEWNRFHYGTTTPADNAAPTPGIIELAASGVDIKYSKRQASGADAVPARSLQFTATRLQILAIDGQDSNNNGDPVKRTVRYKVYAPASGSGLTAILKNGVTAYAAS
jgi:hypothetical protein